MDRMDKTDLMDHARTCPYRPSRPSCPSAPPPSSRFEQDLIAARARIEELENRLRSVPTRSVIMPVPHGSGADTVVYQSMVDNLPLSITARLRLP